MVAKVWQRIFVAKINPQSYGLKENVTLPRGMSYKHHQNYLHFRNTDNKKKGK